MDGQRIDRIIGVQGTGQLLLVGVQEGESA